MAAAALVLIAALVVVLGIAWRLDRRRIWEAPRWSDRGFELIDDRGSDVAAAEHWVVVVQPDCGSCHLQLEAARARARAHPGTIHLTALLVDVGTPARPGVLAELDADRIFWDRQGTWRRRWGHRVYGETMVFSTSGALLRTLPPGSGAREPGSRSALGVPPDDF